MFARPICPLSDGSLSALADSLPLSLSFSFPLLFAERRCGFVFVLLGQSFFAFLTSVSHLPPGSPCDWSQFFILGFLYFWFK